MIINFKMFNFYIIVSNTIFIIGIMGILLAKNLIIWLLSIDLLLISSFLNFIIFSNYYLKVDGFIFSLIIIILAAIEAALGLCFIMLFFNRKKTIQINRLKNIKI